MLAVSLSVRQPSRLLRSKMQEALFDRKCPLFFASVINVSFVTDNEKA